MVNRWNKTVEQLKCDAGSLVYPEAEDAFQELAQAPKEAAIEDLCIDAITRAADEAVRQAAIVCLGSHATPRGVRALTELVLADSDHPTREVAAFHLQRIAPDAAAAALAELSSKPERCSPSLEDALAGRLRQPHYV